MQRGNYRRQANQSNQPLYGLKFTAIAAAQSQKSAPVTPLHSHLYSYPVVILYKLLTLLDKHSEDS